MRSTTPRCPCDFMTSDYVAELEARVDYYSAEMDAYARELSERDDEAILTTALWTRRFAAWKKYGADMKESYDAELKRSEHYKRERDVLQRKLTILTSWHQDLQRVRSIAGNALGGKLSGKSLTMVLMLWGRN